MENFRAYQLSKNFYQAVCSVQWPNHLRDQVLRASSSVVLNLAEGSGLPSKRQKSKHYNIAFGSLRECQAVIEISKLDDCELATLADNLAGHIYKLCKSNS